MINNPALGPTLQQFSGEESGVAYFSKLVPNLIGLGFVVGVVIFMFVLITGAIGWIASGGDKNSLEAARSKLTNGIIGLFILFGSFAIISLIETFFGFNIMTLDIAGLKI